MRVEKRAEKELMLREIKSGERERKKKLKKLKKKYKLIERNKYKGSEKLIYLETEGAERKTDTARVI